MKNRKNKFLALGLGVVLGLSCVFSSYATSADLKDAKKKVSSLQEEKKKVQDTLKQLEGLKSDAAAYVKELDKKLTSLDSELRVRERYFRKGRSNREYKSGVRRGKSSGKGAVCFYETAYPVYV